jgi:hypothetical protein
MGQDIDASIDGYGRAFKIRWVDENQSPMLMRFGDRGGGDVWIHQFDFGMADQRSDEQLDEIGTSIDFRKDELSGGLRRGRFLHSLDIFQSDRGERIAKIKGRAVGRVDSSAGGEDARTGNLVGHDAGSQSRSIREG